MSVLYTYCVILCFGYTHSIRFFSDQFACFCVADGHGACADSNALTIAGRLVAVKYLTLKRYHQRFPAAQEAVQPLKLSGKSPTSLVTFDPDEDVGDLNDSDLDWDERLPVPLVRQGNGVDWVPVRAKAPRVWWSWLWWVGGAVDIFQRACLLHYEEFYVNRKGDEALARASDWSSLLWQLLSFELFSLAGALWIYSTSRSMRLIENSRPKLCALVKRQAVLLGVEDWDWMKPGGRTEARVPEGREVRPPRCCQIVPVITYITQDGRRTAIQQTYASHGTGIRRVYP